MISAHKAVSGALTTALLLGSCGDTQTEYGPRTATHEYLSEVKSILQELRVLEHHIGQAVPQDTVAAEVILPLIENRFRPKLQTLDQRARQLSVDARLDTVHQQLLTYLALRLKAFDKVILAVRGGRPEMLEEYYALLDSADAVGRNLEEAILAVSQRTR